jgi:hypothetical protein
LTCRQLFSRRTGRFGLGILVLTLAAVSAQATPSPAGTFGKLSGIVLDPSGTPQMGATVLLVTESAQAATTVELLTDPRGVFVSGHLLPGYYTVRVTLAGFLPGIERHVHITAHLTTLVKIELDSVFASLDRLRRQPSKQSNAEDWKWVLRTAASMRPVLQWTDGNDTRIEAAALGKVEPSKMPRGRLELTNGANRRGSLSNLPDSPATAFAYDQKIGHYSRLVVAGQVSYEHTATAGLATLWLPMGSLESGPRTTLVLRQAKLGPSGLTFRGLRTDQSGTLDVGDRFTLHYGGEFLFVSLGHSTSAVRPRAELDIRLSENFKASVIAAAEPGAPDVASDDESEQPVLLQTAMKQLDAFPVLLWRNGHPVLEGGWHQEVALERRLAKQTSIQVAAFHDNLRHVAMFGRGTTTNPDFFQDYFSDAFTYDGGSSNSWGARASFREKISDELEVSAVYAYAGALTLSDLATSLDLRDALQTRYRHSLAAGLGARVPKLGTRVNASYKWVEGTTLSHQDRYGELHNHLDPYLHLTVRQPLPRFLVGRWEASADCQNLLAQGYTRVATQDGRSVLVPVLRTFRGGLNFQF